MIESTVRSPRLIGRQAQLALLDQFVQQARTRTGSIVLVAGEAGIGKSRLVREAKSRAEPNGYLILQADCFEPDRDVPYAPLSDLLAAFVHSHPEPPDQLLGSAAPFVARWIPALEDISSSTAKSRVFRALSDFIIRLASRQPVGILIEDLHWCDNSTLDYLLYLAQRIAAHPILLLLTYRNDQIPSNLSHFLSELDRRRLANELLLTPLTRSEVGELIQAILAAPESHALARQVSDLVYSLSEGNPLLLEEMIKAMLVSGELSHADNRWALKSTAELHIPRTVQDATQQRVASVSEPARRALTLAAVAGRRFDFTLLQELTMMDERQLLEIVRELIGAQLIVEESADSFSFRHALTREAVYTTLLLRERKELHRRIGETLERIHANALDAYVPDLALHFFQAGDWAKAVPYARRAGESAQSMYASREAIVHFTRAIQAAQRLAPDRSSIAGVYRARGQAHEFAGEFDAARADYEHELAEAQTARDRRAEWQSLIDLGFLWASRDYVESGEYFQRALTLAREINDQGILAQSLNRLGNWSFNVERTEGLEYHREALDIFVGLNDRKGMADTLDLIALTNLGFGDTLAATAYYERAIKLYRELDDRQGLVSCLATLCERAGHHASDLCVPAVVNLAEAEPQGEEALALARAMDWPSGEVYALTEFGLLLMGEGKYAQALDNFTTAAAISQEIGHHQWEAYAMLWLGVLELDVLAFAESRPHLERGLELLEQTGALAGVRYAQAFLAYLFILNREWMRAEEILAQCLAGVTVPKTILQFYPWHARAELALARGDAKRALDMMDRLLATLRNVKPDTVIPRIWKLRGEAMLALKRFDEAESLLQAARDRAAEQGARPLLWRIHVSLGKAHKLRRHREAAEAEFAAARRVIAELATELVDANLRANFVQRADTTIPSFKPPTTLRASKQAFGGLTARERQVATLIAQGKTNEEIANALVIGERTVESHVSSILAKLGLTARTQIAAWAAERGLSNPIEA